MPPPITELRPWALDQWDALKRRAESQPPASATRSPKGTPTAPEPLIASFTEAITAWLATLSPAQRTRRYTLDEVTLLAKLQGRGAHPPPWWAVGPACHRAGMVNRRDWTRAGRNRRYWSLPPTTTNSPQEVYR